MSGSTLGKNITISTWGESHGEALGVVVDGFPAGLALAKEDIQKFLDRRKRSSDYSEIASYFRPGHADYCFDEKYGFRDYRGGGRSSGRETIGRVAAGALCQKLLSEMGIDVYAYTRSIGDVEIDDEKFDRNAIYTTPTSMPDTEADKKAMDLIMKCRENMDSIGGVIECRIKGVPAGIGEPVFDKLDALLARAVMSIGAVKAVEIGCGTKAAKLYGSENNDEFIYENNSVSKKTNNSGGILGGMSDGSEIVIRAYVKPTPSIARSQNTVNKSNENISINIKGRHDPVVVPRAVVVVESMCAFTLLDLLISNISAKASNIINFYKK